MSDLYADDNLSWAEEFGLSGFEPWEPEDDDLDAQLAAGGCAYCGSPEVREFPEPFGHRDCCNECFDVLIDGTDEL